MSARETFFQKAKRAEVDCELSEKALVEYLDELFDEEVSAWHDTDDSVAEPLHAWLGLTEEKYAALVSAPFDEAIWEVLN